MKTPLEGTLLRIFIGSSDTHNGQPLYQAVVLAARAQGLAGATVLKGPLGFGKHSRIHSAKLLELSTDLPIIIELVDAEDRIAAFLPVVDEMVQEGLVTVEKVKVIKYTAEGC